MANRDFNKIKRTIQDFSQNAGDGSSGGSEIVDALPAQGKEGTTYLLRKSEESGVFKAHAYNPVGTNSQILVTDYSPSEISDSIRKSIGIYEESLPQELLDAISEAIQNFEIMTPEQFEENFPVEYTVIVTNIEELPQTNPDDKDYLQDLGEIGIEDLKSIEFYVGSSKSIETWRITVLPYLDSFTHKTTYTNDTLTVLYREVYYNGNQLYVGEWQTEMPSMAISKYITDEVILDPEELESGKVVIVSMSPEEPTYTYSYTQYVFDKGVYTVLGGENGGDNHNILVQISVGTNFYTFSMIVDKLGISSFDDLFNYFEEKNFTSSYRCPYAVSGRFNSNLLSYVTPYYQGTEEGPELKVLEFTYASSGSILTSKISNQTAVSSFTIDYIN